MSENFVRYLDMAIASAAGGRGGNTFSALADPRGTGDSVLTSVTTRGLGDVADLIQANRPFLQVVQVVETVRSGRRSVFNVLDCIHRLPNEGEAQRLLLTREQFLGSSFQIARSRRSRSGSGNRR